MVLEDPEDSPSHNQKFGPLGPSDWGWNDDLLERTSNLYESFAVLNT